MTSLFLSFGISQSQSRNVPVDSLFHILTNNSTFLSCWVFSPKISQISHIFPPGAIFTNCILTLRSLTPSETHMSHMVADHSIFRQCGPSSFVSPVLHSEAKTSKAKGTAQCDPLAWGGPAVLRCPSIAAALPSTMMSQACDATKVEMYGPGLEPGALKVCRCSALKLHWWCYVPHHLVSDVALCTHNNS